MTIRFTAQFIFAFIALAVLELSIPLQAAASGKPQSPARVSQPSKPFLRNLLDRLHQKLGRASKYGHVAVDRLRRR